MNYTLKIGRFPGHFGGFRWRIEKGGEILTRSSVAMSEEAAREEGSRWLARFSEGAR